MVVKPSPLFKGDYKALADAIVGRGGYKKLEVK